METTPLQGTPPSLLNDKPTLKPELLPFNLMSDLAIYQSALRELIRPKRILIAVILILFPAIYAAVLRSQSDTYNALNTYNELMKQFVFNYILILLALVFSTGAITQEVEQKTIVYLLTRPVPRWRILLMKFAAVFTVTTGTVWLCTIFLAGVCFGVGGLKGSYEVTPAQIKDSRQFVLALKDTPNAALLALHEKFAPQIQKFLDDYAGENAPDTTSLASTVSDLNRILQQETLYSPQVYVDIPLSAELKTEAEKDQGGAIRTRVNRGLLEALLPSVLLPPGGNSTQFWHDLLVLPVGVLAYGSLFLLLAALILRPLVPGLIFAFGWESWVPNMPGVFGRFSLATYLRVLAPHPEPLETTNVTSLISQFSQPASADEITQAFAWGALFLIIAVTLGAALIIFSNKEFVPREDI